MSIQTTTEVELPPLPPPPPEAIMATPDMFEFIEDAEWFQFFRFTEIAERTDGQFFVTVMRGSVPGRKFLGGPWHMHHFDFGLLYVTSGWAEFEFEGVGKVRFEKGMIMHQPAFNRHRDGEMSPDFEGLVILSPAVSDITAWVLDEETGEYNTVFFDESNIGDFQKLQEFETLSE
jgi:hypothetical protein